MSTSRTLPAPRLATHTRLSPAQRNFMPLMAQLIRQWRRAVDRQLEPMGLTEATWMPLLHLARAPEPMRQKDLAASLALDSSSVVRLLDGLQAAGLIERLEGEDRRVKTVHLTAQGLRTVERVEALVDEAREKLFGDIPARDMQAAFRVLEQIGAALACAEKK
jgi:MarR family transcriptional regulator for hemolysin